MHKQALSFLGLFFCIKLVYSQPVFVTVKNETSVDYPDKVVEIPWELISNKWSNTDTSLINLVDEKTKKELPFQLEYRGEKGIRNLLVQLSVKANSSVRVVLQKKKHGFFPSKTFCRYVPERKDDFAWENDKIAHRAYGKALEGTNEDAYGLDVWVKRTNKLILNERYKRGEYHIDHGDGMDYYHVGFSLGAGNAVPYINDSIWYSKNYHDYKVLDNGPLRSTFQLLYDAWNVNGRPVKAIKTFSIDAGSQMTKIKAEYIYEGNDELPVVAGIIKRKDPGEELLNEEKGIVMYWEPQHGEDGTTGVGLVLTKPVKKMMETDKHLLALITTENKAVSYYTGACWDKAGEITNGTQWQKYLENFYRQLQSPLIVVVK